MVISAPEGQAGSVAIGTVTTATKTLNISQTILPLRDSRVRDKLLAVREQTR